MTRSRRAFLRRAAAGAAVVASAPVLGAATTSARAAEREGANGNRRAAAFRVRMRAAEAARARPLAVHATNGDEDALPNYVGSFTKGLPHNDIGEVDPDAYATLLRAVRSGDPADFERVSLGIGPRLVDPQAGLSFDLQGADSHHLTVPPAPAFASARQASEIAELYWMALARDVPFTEYGSSDLVARAAADLSRFSDFGGPKVDGRVMPATIFRGETAGDLVGPWISQFLLQDVKMGPVTYTQRIKTAAAGRDYMTTYDDWLAAQRGPGRYPDEVFDATPRYLRNLRDLARWVHMDVLYQAYLHAALVLLGTGCPIDPGLPGVAWVNEAPFVQFAAPHVLALVPEVSIRALKAAWFQKWFVHRRLRPEEFAARVHHRRLGAAAYPVHPEILESPALDALYAANGTYLLPQAFPEGCPTHPSYTAGHATVAGACVTILKAFFDESFVVVAPVVPNIDGTALVPYDGPALTARNELDKVAANVAIGRNGAGVHWRSDYAASLRLGEEVAICLLEEQKATFNMDVTWRFTRFDGTPAEI